MWELSPGWYRQTAAPDRRQRPKRSAIATSRIRRGRGGGAAGAAAAAAEAATEWIDLDKPVYLSLEGRWTKKTGYARLENGKVERLVYVDKSVRGLEKAKDAERLVYQAGAWDQSPNFFTAGHGLEEPRAKVSDTNPFASQYAWGSAELVDYKNSHGDRLQGALYYPANYEKGKQYPMIVQIYEIKSNQLHNWTAPSERATYNATVWTQNGYFVLSARHHLPPARAGAFRRSIASPPASRKCSKAA